jgi:hypothetical protein
MRKSEHVSEFETYLKERQRRTRTALTAIEKAGIEAALDRCRALAHRIPADLRHKKPEHFVNVTSLADFQVSLERAASVLEHESRRFRINPSEHDSVPQA